MHAVRDKRGQENHDPFEGKQGQKIAEPTKQLKPKLKVDTSNANTDRGDRPLLCVHGVETEARDPDQLTGSASSVGTA